MTFDSRGAHFAFAFFALMALVLLVGALVDRRLARQLSLRTRSAMLIVPMTGCAVLLYWWLFWHRFYGLTAGDGTIELMFELPRRHVQVPAASIARVVQEPRPKLQSRIRLELTDGTVFYSPERSRSDLERVVRLIEGARRVDSVR